ncbi:MAG: hypothetical protein ACLFVJ_12960 [Persicimonas sp.]
MREELHADDRLAVYLTVEDDEIVRLDVDSRDPETYDLSVEDDVIIFMDGDPVDVEVDDASHAVAELGPAEELFARSFGVILRIHDFFEGWDFGES